MYLTVLQQPNAFFHTTDSPTRLVISTCCLCGRKAASRDTEMLKIAERTHACSNEVPSAERAAGSRENG